MKQIGEQIRKLRIEAGMTRIELAEKLGVSLSAIGMYEQGRRTPQGDMLVKLCQVFSVTADSLLGVREKPREAVDVIKEMSERIRNDKSITLNGSPMSKEDREKLLNLIEAAASLMVPKVTGVES